MPKKLALCFLTYGNLSQPVLWNRIFERHSDLVNVYIHNKNDFVDTECHVERYCLKERIPTEWGSLSLVEATLLLFRTALLDPENEFFVLLSDKCIPIRPIEEIYKQILEANSNMIRSTGPSPSRYNMLRDKTLFIEENFKKQAQWCILKRETAEFFSTRDFTWIFKEDCGVPDEHYFINLCLLHNIPFIDTIVTSARWGSDVDHPHTFEVLTPEDLLCAQESGALFMRKISEKCKLPTYYDKFL